MPEYAYAYGEPLWILTALVSCIASSRKSPGDMDLVSGRFARPSDRNQRFSHDALDRYLYIPPWNGAGGRVADRRGWSSRAWCPVALLTGVAGGLGGSNPDLMRSGGWWERRGLAGGATLSTRRGGRRGSGFVFHAQPVRGQADLEHGHRELLEQPKGPARADPRFRTPFLFLNSTARRPGRTDTLDGGACHIPWKAAFPMLYRTDSPALELAGLPEGFRDRCDSSPPLPFPLLLLAVDRDG